MSITEADRHEIYELIKEARGDRIANNVMSMFPPVGWADVATKADLHALSDRIEGKVDRLEGKLDRLDGKVDRSEGSLRAEIHQSVRNQTWALVAWSSAMAGLVVALVR